MSKSKLLKLLIGLGTIALGVLLIIEKFEALKWCLVVIGFVIFVFGLTKVFNEKTRILAIIVMVLGVAAIVIAFAWPQAIVYLTSGYLFATASYRLYKLDPDKKHSLTVVIPILMEVAAFLILVAGVEEVILIISGIVLIVEGFIDVYNALKREKAA